MRVPKWNHVGAGVHARPPLQLRQGAGYGRYGRPALRVVEPKGSPADKNIQDDKIDTGWRNPGRAAGANAISRSSLSRSLYNLHCGGV